MLKNTLKHIIVDSLMIFWGLCKILIPIILLLKLLEPLGAIEFLASLLEPTMGLVGLPGYTAIVWASAMFGNLYTGLIVLMMLWDQQPLSVAEVSTLCLMMLVAHGLLVEGIIAHKSGSNIIFSLTWRLANAYLMGWITYLVTYYFSFFSEPATVYLQPNALSENWQQWLLEQFNLLGQIYLIILVLSAFIYSLKKLGIEGYLHRMLLPFLKIFGLGHQTANITLIGVFLGVSYGAAFLIDDVKKKRVSKQEGCVVLSILNLNHSLIEDTLLMLLVGSTLWVVLMVRLLLGLSLAFLFARCLYYCPSIQRWVVT